MSSPSLSPAPTDSDAPQIRLLTLHPSPPSTPIRCTLNSVSLSNPPPYTSLSYVWGPPSPTQQITVSNRPVHVTCNLYAALQRLRYADRPRTLWIDQLCINQWDLSEKARQVRLMREIYRRCEECVFWLGEIPRDEGFEHEDAESVFEFLRDVAGADKKRVEGLPKLFLKYGAGPRVRRAFAAFAMYGNEWWTRAWTIQEAIIPPAAQFVWGELRISREDVLCSARRLRGDQLERFFAPPFPEYRKRYYDLLRRLLYPIHGFNHSSKGEEPLDLFMRWRHRDATDPRDKVYALLGLLAHNAVPSAERCDYDVSEQELFANVTVDLIMLEKGLRTLIGACDMVHVTPGLPSWSIDFASCMRVGKHQLRWWGHSHRYKQFSACGEYELQVNRSEAPNVLYLTGVYIDEVSVVSAVYTVDADSVIEIQRIRDAIGNFKDLVEGSIGDADSSKYIGGGSLKSAFWRTMVSDLQMAEFPVQRVTPEQEADFEELVEEHSNFDANPLYESIGGMIPNHAFFVTKKGYIGIGSSNTQPGDQIWILYGGQVPFTLRRTEQHNEAGVPRDFSLVGDTYVHGLMEGEGVRDSHNTSEVWLH